MMFIKFPLRDNEENLLAVVLVNETVSLLGRWKQGNLKIYNWNV